MRNSTCQPWILLLASWAVPCASAQDSLPILRSSSGHIDVLDGDRLLKDEWTAYPDVPFDVYFVRRSAHGKRVTFRSDLDSLAFDIEPGHTYDFVLQLGSDHSCHTRVSTRTSSFTRGDSVPRRGPVEIPIRIEHGKVHLDGSFNGSRTLDLIFDTGASVNVVYPAGLGKGVVVHYDATINNVGAGTTLRQIAFDNHVEVNGLSWEHEPILFVEKQADVADGIVGYGVFEDKVLEFDYDRLRLIVHDELPAHAAQFGSIAMSFSGALTSVDVTLVHGEQRSTGGLCLDTGGAATILVNKAFGVAHGLQGALEKIGEGRASGVGSVVAVNDVLRLPELELAGFRLANVPIQVGVSPEDTATEPGGVLCMEILERFNAILDYPSGRAYFKPNSRFEAPFPLGRGGPSVRQFLAILLLLAAVTGTVVYLVRRRMSRTRAAH